MQPDIPITLESVRDISSIRPDSLKESSLYTANVSTDKNTRYLLKGIQESSPLSELFFSNANVNEVQRLLRYNVYKSTESKFVIDNQNVTELLLVMRGIFLQYQGGRFPGNNGNDPLLVRSDSKIDKKYRTSKQFLKDELVRLNTLVVREILPKVISEIEQYYGYLRDSTNPYNLIDRPVNPSVKGVNTELRDTSDILFI